MIQPLIKDRNKSELTHKITAGAKNWLLGIGAKPVEEEVCIAEGWIADIAAIWIPTPSEAIISKLMERRPDWKKIEARQKWNESYQKLPTPISICHEVKVTPGDYRKDVDRKFKHFAAHMNILSIPSGMAMPPESPEPYWWLLQHDKNGQVRSGRPGKLIQIPERSTLDFIVALSMRQYNRVTYSNNRELTKKYRAEEHAVRTSVRMARIVRQVLGYFKDEHDDLELMLKEYGYNHMAEDVKLEFKRLKSYYTNTNPDTHKGSKI